MFLSWCFFFVLVLVLLQEAGISIVSCMSLWYLAKSKHGVNAPLISVSVRQECIEFGRYIQKTITTVSKW